MYTYLINKIDLQSDQMLILQLNQRISVIPLKRMRFDPQLQSEYRIVDGFIFQPLQLSSSTHSAFTFLFTSFVGERLSSKKSPESWRRKLHFSREREKNGRRVRRVRRVRRSRRNAQHARLAPE